MLHVSCWCGKVHYMKYQGLRCYVCLLTTHPHAYQQVHVKDRPYLGELCAEQHDAN